MALIKEIIAQHQSTGSQGVSWDNPEGFSQTCSCGWSKSYRNMNNFGRHLHSEHVQEELEKEGYGHIPQFLETAIKRLQYVSENGSLDKATHKQIKDAAELFDAYLVTLMKKEVPSEATKNVLVKQNA